MKKRSAKRETVGVLLTLGVLIAVLVRGSTPSDKPIAIIEMVDLRGDVQQLWCMPDGSVMASDGRKAVPVPEARCAAP